jgi:hypothetical protein
VLTAAELQQLQQQLLAVVETLLNWQPVEVSLLLMRLKCLHACAPVIKVPPDSSVTNIITAHCTFIRPDTAIIHHS